MLVYQLEESWRADRVSAAPVVLNKKLLYLDSEYQTITEIDLSRRRADVSYSRSTTSSADSNFRLIHLYKQGRRLAGFLQNNERLEAELLDDQIELDSATATWTNSQHMIMGAHEFCEHNTHAHNSTYKSSTRKSSIAAEACVKVTKSEVQTPGHCFSVISEGADICVVIVQNLPNILVDIRAGTILVNSSRKAEVEKLSNPEKVDLAKLPSHVDFALWGDHVYAVFSKSDPKELADLTVVRVCIVTKRIERVETSVPLRGISPNVRCTIVKEDYFILICGDRDGTTTISKFAWSHKLSTNMTLSPTSLRTPKRPLTETTVPPIKTESDQENRPCEPRKKQVKRSAKLRIKEEPLSPTVPTAEPPSQSAACSNCKERRRNFYSCHVCQVDGLCADCAIEFHNEHSFERCYSPREAKRKMEEARGNVVADINDSENMTISLVCEIASKHKATAAQIEKKLNEKANSDGFVRKKKLDRSLAQLRKLKTSFEEGNRKIVELYENQGSVASCSRQAIAG